MKSYIFIIAIILYATLSSPTPDTVTWVEYSVGALLVVFVGVIGGWNAIAARGLPMTYGYHRAFIAFMMSVPLVMGVVNGHAPSDIIRDIIPIAFLVLPLVFYQSPIKYMDILLMVAGGLFAVRYLAPLVPQLSFIGAQRDLLYLANSPFIPFAAIIGFAWVSDHNKILFSKRLLGLAVMIACFAAMAVMMQRAPIILTALACLVVLAIRSVHRPIHSMVIGAVLMACLLPVFPLIIEISQGMIEKTLSVGVNNRIEELSAIISQATLLGEGWGAMWQSPAVGDMWVRYTHNIVSYYWLKAGAIGAVLSIIFILFWGREIFKIIRENPALGLAIATPFLIHVTLYSGFKTLDFACLLALCGAWRANQNQS